MDPTPPRPDTSADDSAHGSTRIQRADFAEPAAPAAPRKLRFKLSELEALEASRATARLAHGWDCRCCNA